jgi:predicted CXXCH cytochrome family protein
VPREGATLYTGLDTRCAGCHADRHNGQFRLTGYERRCESCHGTHAFLPSTFTLTRHESTRFPLTGAHGAVACSDCHDAAASAGNKEGFRFHFSDLACASCHKDPHQGQFSVRMNTARPDGYPAGCGACHNTRSWLDLSGFDHATTRFLLSGTHGTVACGSCHKPAGAGNSVIVWRSAPRACSGCHEDVHGGQFTADSDGVDCSRCHQPLRWIPANYDRESHTSWPLAGAHRDVPCTLCHARKDQANGRSIFVYRGTPRECSGCHGNTQRGRESEGNRR